jgi:hypothetical protein
LASYYCNCLPTWSGRLCDGIWIKNVKLIFIFYLFLVKIISPCSKSPCSPGKCFQLDDRNIPFVCLCPNGQFGLNCHSKCVLIYLNLTEKWDFYFERYAGICISCVLI